MSKDTSSDIISGEIRTIDPQLIYDPTRKLGERELRSVYALIAYVAYNLEVEESEIMTMTSKSYGVSKIEDIPLGSYIGLVDFIVEFTNPSDMMN